MQIKRYFGIHKVLTQSLAQTDSQLFNLIQKEKTRIREGLNLIASENYPSLSVLEAAGSCLQTKYSEGYPH
jgi:glycine hydroxymethyltransferase